MSEEVKWRRGSEGSSFWGQCWFVFSCSLLWSHVMWWSFSQPVTSVFTSLSLIIWAHRISFAGVTWVTSTKDVGGLRKDFVRLEEMLLSHNRRHGNKTSNLFNLCLKKGIHIMSRSSSTESTMSYPNTGSRVRRGVLSWLQSDRHAGPSDIKMHEVNASRSCAKLKEMRQGWSPGYLKDEEGLDVRRGGRATGTTGGPLWNVLGDAQRPCCLQIIHVRFFLHKLNYIPETFIFCRIQQRNSLKETVFTELEF